MFTVRVPATSANMGPAFDTAGIAVQLYNTIKVYTEKDKEFEGKFFIKSINNINNQIEGSQAIPTDESNLIYKTICNFAEQKGKEVPRIYIEQYDEIPLARGLGSSAACIVAGLLIANELLETKCSREELLHMAVLIEGHPDNVAPAFLGDMVVGALDGERFEYVKIPVSEELEFISLIPDFSLYTSEARGVMPESYTREQVVFNFSRIALLVASMMSGNFDALSIAMQDNIHQPYRMTLIPGMEELLNRAIELGCYGGFLSGAGPTLMLVNKKGNNIREEINKTINELDNFWLARLIEIDREGAKIIY